MTTAETFTSNPLVEFRKPEKMAKRSGVSHFSTKRDDVENAQGLISVYPGEFTYMPDPTLEIQLAFWEESDDQRMLALYYKMTGDGYQVAMAKDWKIAERLTTTWKGDGAGRITLGGRSDKTIVMMWRTGESYDKVQEKRLRHSTDIQKSVEEKQAEIGAKLAPLGARVSFTVQDDDGSDDDETAQSQKTRR